VTNSKWSLSKLMEGLHERVAQDLKTARETLGHPGAKGDGSEKVWIKLFTNYLPKRYAASKATVVDSRGKFSDQIDVVLYDRQYTPLIFELEGEIVVPAEAVYAVFESKQEINAQHIAYAQKKAKSVRKLHRTSAQVQTIEGMRRAALQPILAGFLAFDSGWSRRSVSKYLLKALEADQRRLDIGCVAAYGTFGCEGADCISSAPHDRATTCFLLELITRLQQIGTAPAIDMSAYTSWLTS
jgi:hypothetical protein